VVAPSSSREPGTLQAGIWQSQSSYLPAASLAARADGSVVCVTCSGVVILDAGAREIGRPTIPDNSAPSIAVAPDDTTYLLPGSELISLSPAGDRRWLALFIPGPPGPFETLGPPLVAGRAGAYLEGQLASGDGSGSTTATIVGFDAATGARRRLATGQHLLGAARDGVFTVEGGHGGPSATLHQLDPAGKVVWSHALSSTQDGLELRKAVAMPDGGAVVFGSTRSMLEFGDRTLAATSEVGFVAGFDAAGATRWAFAVTSFGIADIAVIAQDEILIAGRSVLGGAPQDDAALAVATPAGIARTLDIGGTEDQVIRGLTVTPDGLAWVQIDSVPTDDPYTAVMHIGAHTFPEQGTYLFRLVP